MKKINSNKNKMIQFLKYTGIFIIALLIAGYVLGHFDSAYEKYKRNALIRESERARSDCNINNLSKFCKKQSIWACHEGWGFHCHSICLGKDDHQQKHCIEYLEINQKKDDFLPDHLH